jgi:hypothetical protein
MRKYLPVIKIIKPPSQLSSPRRRGSRRLSTKNTIFNFEFKLKIFLDPHLRGDGKERAATIEKVGEAALKLLQL